jgi:hypothetical protein
MSTDGAGSTLRQTPITKDEILRIDYAMMVLVSVFIFARVVFQAARRKNLELQDYFIYLAYAFYLSLCILYIIVTPILFRIQDVAAGLLPMPSDFLSTAGYTSRLIFSAQMCFYACLWSVKFSLLCLYRKLLVGLPQIYIRIWWAIVVICFLVCKNHLELLSHELTVCLVCRRTSVLSLRVLPRARTCMPSLKPRNATLLRKLELRRSVYFLHTRSTYSRTF